MTTKLTEKQQKTWNRFWPHLDCRLLISPRHQTGLRQPISLIFHETIPSYAIHPVRLAADILPSSWISSSLRRVTQCKTVFRWSVVQSGQNQDLLSYQLSWSRKWPFFCVRFKTVSIRLQRQRPLLTKTYLLDRSPLFLLDGINCGLNAWRPNLWKQKCCKLKFNSKHVWHVILITCFPSMRN